MRSLFKQCVQSLWGPPAPKVIWLRGDSAWGHRIDRQESPYRVQEVLQSLAPDPFRLELGENHQGLLQEDLAAPIRLAWLERGYRMPPLVLQKSKRLEPDQARLCIYGVDEPTLSLKSNANGLSAREIVQLELARAVVLSLKRVVNRDFVRELAEQQGLHLPHQQLGRLSKYFRARWQAGLSLPPVQEWPSLSESAPFDDIGMLEEPLQYRRPLSAERRKSILLRAASQSSFLTHLAPGEGPPTAIEQLQALEEFSYLEATMAPENPALSILRNTLLANRLADFQVGCRCQPEAMLQRILCPTLPIAPTLPIFQRISLEVQTLGPREKAARSWLESHLGNLAQVQTPSN